MWAPLDPLPWGLQFQISNSSPDKHIVFCNGGATNKNMLLFATLRYLKLKIPKKYKYLSPGSIRLQVPNKSIPVGRAGYNPIGFRCPVNPSDSQLVFFQSSGGFPFSWFIRLFVKSYLQVKDLQKY